MELVSNQTLPQVFFTVRLSDRRSDALIRHFAAFQEAVDRCRSLYPFTINRSVVLPNRTHMIWTLPLSDTDYARRWRLIKAGFARHIPTEQGLARRAVARGPGAVWQQRFWDIPIVSTADFEIYDRLIRDAPVDEGLVSRAEDWHFRDPAPLPDLKARG